jgi:hypothetical protein
MGNVLNYTSDFTFAAWIKPDDLDSTQTIVSKVKDAGEKQYALQINTDGNLVMHYERAGSNYSLTSGGALSAGAWQFVAMTVDSDLNIKLYVGDTAVATDQATAETIITSDSFNIGRLGGTYNSGYFDGLMDEVKFYNYALSASEISDLYDGSTSIPTPTSTPTSTPSGTYQAEEVNIYNGTVSDEYAGYTGTGYVDFQNQTGSYVEFNVSVASAGNHTLTEHPMLST